MKREAQQSLTRKPGFKTMAKALYMEELVTHHGAIMDQYDPEKKSA